MHLFISLTLLTVSTKGIWSGAVYTHWWKIKCCFLPFLPIKKQSFVNALYTPQPQTYQGQFFKSHQSFHSCVTETPSHEKSRVAMARRQGKQKTQLPWVQRFSACATHLHKCISLSGGSTAWLHSQTGLTPEKLRTITRKDTIGISGISFLISCHIRS